MEQIHANLLLLCIVIFAVTAVGTYVIRMQKKLKKTVSTEKMLYCRDRIICCGKYAGNLKWMAKRVKCMEDSEAVLSAAKLMSPVIPERAILIPVPGHTGVTTYTKELCKAIVNRRKDLLMADFCVGHSRQSWCEMKKRFRHDGTDFLPDSEFFGFKLSGKPDFEEEQVVFIDNVADTGVTMAYAMSLVEGSAGLVLAMTEEKL